MLSDEEKEILINIKEYMQNDIDKGYHKFVYNDLGSDFKCIDCINAIDNVLNLIEKQQKEIENLKEQNKNLNWYFENQKDNFVHKDKIKAKIEEYENKIKKIRSKKIINEPEDTIIITRYAHYISVLQSLLEKE